jgi:trigger factor
VKVTKKELEKCEFLISIEFEKKEADKLLKKTTQEMSKDIKIPGFRPGKVPYQVIARRLGPEIIQEEFFKKNEQVIQQALDEADIVIYGKPSLEEFNLRPLEIKLRVPSRPKVILGNYRDIQMEVPPVKEVTDDDINKILEQLQEENAIWNPVERPANVGDSVSMLVTERYEKQVFTDNESIDYVIELSETAEDAPTPHDMFAKKLIGLSAGDQKVLTLMYPEDYDNLQYAGKEIIYELEVSSIKEKEIDPLDDDFAQTVSEMETLEELKEHYRQELREHNQYQRDYKLGHAVLEEAISQAESVEWSAILEEQLITQQIALQERRLKESGLKMEDYYKIEKTDAEAWREKVREQIAENLTNGIVVNEIAEQENITVSNQEVLERAKYQSETSRMGDAMWQEIIKSEALQKEIEGNIQSEKVIMRLAEIVKGEAPVASEPEEETTSEEEVVPDETKGVEIE